MNVLPSFEIRLAQVTYLEISENDSMGFSQSRVPPWDDSIARTLREKNIMIFTQPPVTVQQSGRHYAATCGCGGCLVFPQTFKKWSYDNDFKFNTIFFCCCFKKDPHWHLVQSTLDNLGIPWWGLVHGLWEDVETSPFNWTIPLALRNTRSRRKPFLHLSRERFMWMASVMESCVSVSAARVSAAC